MNDSAVPALNDLAKSLGLPAVVGGYMRDGQSVYCIFARRGEPPYTTHDPEDVKAKPHAWAERRRAREGS